MNQIPVIAVFDIGRTNKKLFLFNEQYSIVQEWSAQLPETIDEDGFPCEDILLLSSWLAEKFAEALTLAHYQIRAVNVSAYGASLVHLDTNGQLLTPLYNYLKPYPRELENRFYSSFGGKTKLCTETASPALGSLNSGLQLYRLKIEKPHLFNKIDRSLHLPQYLSFLLCGHKVSEITSLGCHTHLWDFSRKNYHQWVGEEGLLTKLAPIRDGASVLGTTPEGVAAGAGLHDSSAALIPYLCAFTEPFLLLSTGTWSISLNPFNQLPLTAEQLESDCLSYLDYTGRQVKASRLLTGFAHDEIVERYAAHFHKDPAYFMCIRYDPLLIRQNQSAFFSSLALQDQQHNPNLLLPDPAGFSSFDAAYHAFLFALVKQQAKRTRLVLENSGVKQIFVDGGFSQNTLYMQLLANEFPELDVFAASVSQASAMGAALILHKEWNNDLIPKNLVQQQLYIPR